MRKAIAKVLTVLSEKRRASARIDTRKRKYTPKDLRIKGTRSFRRKLTKHEAALKTPKQQKKIDNFKLRKFALAA